MRRVLAVFLALVTIVPASAPPAAAAPPAPVLVAPSPGAHVTGTPVLGWNAAPGASRYRVQVAGIDGFGSPTVDATTTNRWYTTAVALSPGPHAWRVAALASDGAQGAWSSGTFTVVGVLGTPQLTPAVVVAPWPMGSRTVSWGPVPGAAAYDLRLTTGPREALDDNDGFRVPGPRWVVSTQASGGLLAPVWYWQVRAVGRGGTASPWSEVGELRSSWTTAPAQSTPDGAELGDLIFDWDPMPGADGYQVEVEGLEGQGQRYSGGAEASWTRVLSHPGGHPAFQGEARYGAFRWRVRATSRSNFFSDLFASPWSPWRSVTVIRSAPPVGILPPPGAVVADTPDLAWTPVPRAITYMVEVSADPAFVTGVYRMGTEDATLGGGTYAGGWAGRHGPLPLADDTTYHWRVRADARAPDGGTEWSVVRSFTIDRAPIEQLGPADGATVDLPSFTWEPGGRYLFDVIVRNAAGVHVASGRTEASRWTPRTRLNPAAGPFSWRVEARSAEDPTAVLARSTWRTFVLVAPAVTTSEPVILDPPDEPTYTIRWTPVTGADHYDIVASWGDGDGTDPLNKDGPLAYPSFTHPGSRAWPGWPLGGFEQPVSWRVVAFAADGTEIGRGPTRLLELPVPGTPEVLGPTACASAACGTPRSPMFSWAPVPRATSYQVRTTGDWTMVTGGTRAWLLWPQPVHHGTFSWQVRACSYTSCGAFSAPRSYTWTRIAPTLVGPPDGAEVVDEAVVSMTGGIPPAAAPGEQAAWTYQDRRLMFDVAAYAAGDSPYGVTWGFAAPGYNAGIGEARTFTIRSSVPTRAEPGEGATVDATPLLRWSPLAGPRGYAVEVHRGSSGPMDANTYVTGGMAYTAAFVSEVPLAPGTYRWRVRRATRHPHSIQPLDGGPWSQAWGFVVGGASPAVLQDPPHGATVGPSDMLLTWLPVAGASGYRTELSRSSSFATVDAAETTVPAAWAPSSGLAGGTWYWRVVALGAMNAPISQSMPRSLVVDAAGPTVTAPLARPIAGAGLGATTVATRVSWTAADASGGVERFELEVSRDGGGYVAASLPGPRATSVDVALWRSGSYRYRVRGVDAAGNAGPWVAGAVIRPTLIADTAAATGGTWRRAYAASYVGGSTRYATARGASASYTFTGSAVVWVAHRAPLRGLASVYLDGRWVATVNLRASTTQARRQVFTYSWPTVGRHTIRIVVAGTAGRPRVDVDSFVVFR